MKRALLLHIGDDVALRTSRSMILRSAFDVIDCNSHDARTILLSQPHVQAVVICGSIEGTMQELLLTRLRQSSPTILILQMGIDLGVCAPNTVIIDSQAPQGLVIAIANALVDHERRTFRRDPPSHSLGKAGQDRWDTR